MIQNNESGAMDYFSNYIEPFMLLNRGNCGEDDSIISGSSQSRVTKRGNHVKFERVGTSTAYRSCLLYGGNMKSGKGSMSADIVRSLNPVPIVLPAKNADADYVVDISLRNHTSAEGNGTLFYFATYDETTDTYDYMAAGAFMQNIQDRNVSANLSKLLPNIDANRNIIILCTIRTGVCEGDVYFNIRVEAKEVIT